MSLSHLEQSKSHIGSAQVQLHAVDYTGFTGKHPYSSDQRASKVCLFTVPHRQLELYILGLYQPVGPIDWTRVNAFEPVNEANKEKLIVQVDSMFLLATNINLFTITFD